MYRLRIGHLSTPAISVVRSPHVSALTWLIDASTPHGTRYALASSLKRSLSAEGRRVCPAIGMPGLDRLPERMVAPDVTAPDSLATFTQRLADVDGSTFARELTTLWNGNPPGPWRAAVQGPYEWLRSARLAFVEAWSIGRQHWRSADRLLRHEEARIGAAAVTGTLDVLLDSLSPRIAVRDGHIEFDSPCDRTVDLGTRKLLFVPMLTPTHRMVVSFEGPGDAYIGYPMADARSTFPRDCAVEGKDVLALLVGPVRASMLRTVERPHDMNTLSQLVHCAPSTLTYHCNHLVAAGLLRRERRGRSIWVSRTDRATRLLQLLSDQR